MKKKKKVFLCAKCGSQTEIYKKGKGHRLLICPKCGIIATNPIPLLAIAGAVGVAKDVYDSVKKPKKETEKSEKVYIDNLDKPNRNERIINQVLYGE